MLWIDPSTLFSLAGQTMLVLWLLLIVSLWLTHLQAVADAVSLWLLPVVFGLLYVLLLTPGLPFEQGGFGSLEQVRILFADDHMLMAGWLHFLVFDYFVGGWIARDQRREPIWAIAVVPALLLSFLAGPAGLLLYLLTRQIGRSATARRIQT